MSQLMDRAGCAASAFLLRQWKDAKAQGSWTVGLVLYKYVRVCVCVYTSHVLVCVVSLCVLVHVEA